MTKHSPNTISCDLNTMEPTCQNGYQHKKGTCVSCRFCIKCPPSSNCKNPDSHSPTRKRGRPPSTDTTPIHTPDKCTRYLTPPYAKYSDFIVTHALENHPHIPERLSCIDPNRESLELILEKLPIPLQFIQNIPIDGISGVSENSKSEKRTNETCIYCFRCCS